jgi:exodeoxyribonuclease-3
MKIMSWNVNSVRVRLDRLVALLGRHRPDALCLQELKVVDEDFPHAEVEAAGYRALTHGQKTYNGVAILTPAEVTDVARGFGDEVDDPQARLIRARVGGVNVVSVYVPNGGEVGGPRWPYKLEWLGRLRRWLEANADPAEPWAVCGDFNIAPDERDVAYPDRWVGDTLTHAEVRAAFEGLTRWGLVDTFRLRHPEGGFYSWWDYRNLAFPKGDGLRIDFVLATTALAERCRAVGIDRDERKGKQASDHAPVWAEFET